MKKFSFSWTVFAVSMISLSLFSACNKQNTEIAELQNELEKYEDYEKFVSLFRLTPESAKELIDFHSKIEPTESEEYNNYVKEITNSNPEQIVERQNKAIQKTLKALSTRTVVELDNMIEEVRLNKAKNTIKSEESAQSRSSLGMTFGGSVYGVPAAVNAIDLFYILDLRNDYHPTTRGTYVLTSDILIPITAIPDGEAMDFSAYHWYTHTSACYDGLYITLALQQPSSLASRSAFYWGGNGYWGGASLDIPSFYTPNHIYTRTLFINGTCNNVEPVFPTEFGLQTGCVGTNYTMVSGPTPNNIIHCN